MPVPLSLATLDELPRRVGRPGYARGALSAGIVHFGVGNFHRAHQARALDALMERGEALDWGIVGTGVMKGERAMHAALAQQDWLTTVVEQSATASEARVVGSMVDYVMPGDAAATVARIARPDIRIVSLTVTEGGYFLDAAGGFDAAHPAIVADARAPDAPRTAFGILLAALRARRAAGSGPLTVMSCDNIPHNGAVARAAVTGLARLSDPGLAAWVEAEVAFPDSMVDRITPATGARERARIREEWGVADDAPVFCEDFAQWVLEDRFAAGRPPLEAAGVRFVADVAPYELMKLRILNGGHAALAYPAALLGLGHAHEAMGHPPIAAYLRRLEETEILPTVPPVPGIELTDYLATIERRFANPKVADAIERLCYDGSNRQPKFILPTVRDALAGGSPLDGLALESALWCRYCAGTDESGGVFPPNDPDWCRLVATARQARSDPGAWLAMRAIYGDLGEADAFARPFARWLHALWEDGTMAALNAYAAAS